MLFEFDWDSAKAERNRRKHAVAFEAAMGITGDPLALSLRGQVVAGRILARGGPMISQGLHLGLPDGTMLTAIEPVGPTGGAKLLRYHRQAVLARIVAEVA